MIWIYFDKIIIIYLDDIFIYLINKKDHEKYVKEVLEYLKAVNLFFKLEKCEFYKKRIIFLRYVITSDEIEINFDKIKII